MHLRTTARRRSAQLAPLWEPSDDPWTVAIMHPSGMVVEEDCLSIGGMAQTTTAALARSPAARR